MDFSHHFLLHAAEGGSGVGRLAGETAELEGIFMEFRGDKSAHGGGVHGFEGVRVIEVVAPRYVRSSKAEFLTGGKGPDLQDHTSRPGLRPCPTVRRLAPVPSTTSVPIDPPNLRQWYPGSAPRSIWLSPAYPNRRGMPG